MNYLIVLLLVVLFNSPAICQKIECDSIEVQVEYDNIHVHKLSSDSLSSSFLIFIKEKVAMHKHEFHSENVYVLEGSATMLLDSSRFTIKAGDFIFIPKNTWHEVTVTSDVPLKVISIQSPFFDGTDRIIFKNQ